MGKEKSGVPRNKPSYDAEVGKIWFPGGGVTASVFNSHKDRHDPNDGADPVDTANAAEIAGVQAAGTGTSHSLARADHVHDISHAITDNHLVTVDQADAADNDFAKFTADGLEGRSYAETLADLSGQAGAAFSWNSQNLTNTGTITAATSLWYHCVYIDVFSLSVGASGATWVAMDGSTLGGYQLDAATEYLYEHFMVCDDWDDASDLYVSVIFEVNVDNTGGAVDDDVVLNLLCQYKGNGQTAIRTQTPVATVVVGQSARYKRFTATFTIDYDLLNNVVVDGDVIAARLNLDTATGDVDNIIVVEEVFFYKTNKPAREVV